VVSYGTRAERTFICYNIALANHGEVVCNRNSVEIHVESVNKIKKWKNLVNDNSSH